MICRAKSLLTKKFVYGGFVQGKNAWIVQINSEGSFSHILVDPETVEWLEPEKWIPVTKRQPEKHGRYLTVCETLNTPQIRLYEGDWDSIHKVTHWMPLPEMPIQKIHF